MTLDFLQHIGREPKQLDLFDGNLRDEIDVSAFFASITETEVEKHKEVWRKLRPRTESEKFLRWLFAYCSVHTTYQLNMSGFGMLKNWYEWVNRPDALKERIKISGMGLYNQRTKYLIQFAIEYWCNPSFFEKQDNETWIECRNRIAAKILGLGKAKVSFALEMLYTEECEAVCLDTHIFQAYGYDQKKDISKYDSIESHWIQLAKVWNVPSPIARAIYWNRNKGEEDCWYWAKVLAN